jgi:hypothetical protein
MTAATPYEESAGCDGKAPGVQVSAGTTISGFDFEAGASDDFLEDV